MDQSATTIQLLGAGGFGILVGWYVYYINRHRTDEVRFADLVSVIGAIGGGAVLALFPAGTDLFGAYGVGLFIGFFGYLLVLVVLVGISKNFGIDYFIDGRKKRLAENEEIEKGPASGAMGGADDDAVRQ